MNATQRALSTFRQPPCMYNCAQTICAAFDREDLLPQARECAGGRAPGGLCGALWGAMQVCPERAEEIKAAFLAANGAVCCRELKGAGRVPCTTCVRTAAELLQK